MRDKKGGEEKNGKKKEEKGRKKSQKKRKTAKNYLKKLVKNFRLRHTLNICYGEENSSKKFRGGGEEIKL